MSDSSPTDRDAGHASPQEMTSALFANLVIQQTNMALMLLGRVPNPESGERVQDLDAARMFIDQLEMIEVKTKGNLDQREQQLLKQSLTTLRMAFVEAIDSAPSTSPGPASSAPAGKPATEHAPAEPGKAATDEEEHRKKFSKKY